MYYNKKLIDGVWCYKLTPNAEFQPMTSKMLHDKIATLYGEKLETTAQAEKQKNRLNLIDSNQIEVKIVTPDGRTPKDIHGNKINNHIDIDFHRFDDEELVKATCLYEQQRFSQFFPTMRITVTHQVLSSKSGTWMSLGQARPEGWVEL